MLAATKPVESALNHKGCDAWQLQLDKFSFQRGGTAAAKTESLQVIQQSYNQRAVGHLAPVCNSVRRFLDTLRRQHGTRFVQIDLFADSPVLIHLGRASVLENVGLCADRTTGLPIIPGTALKGILSTWACWEANQKPDGSFNQGAAFLQTRKDFPRPVARQIFGDDSSDGSERAGDVIFVGGFPATPPRLGLDIVNPHHEADGRLKANLTPNTFLSVQPGSKWLFAFYIRPGSPNAAALCLATADWLTEALTQIGIGAKTAAGYGRFRKPTAADRAVEAQEIEKVKAAEAKAAEQTRLAADSARKSAVAQAILAADYSEASFKNLVRLTDSKGQWRELEKEIERLRKPANSAWLQRFKDATKGKDYKELRKQSWYPQ
jgi:CRISPR-associated protein Cmr6